MSDIDVPMPFPATGDGPFTAMARQQALDWSVRHNHTVSDYPRDRSVASVFFDVARATPDAPAVLDGAGLAYGELARQARRVGAWLLEQGVLPEERVGVVLERGVDIAPVLLGVLAAGAAYVPLDPDLPGQRLSHILRDTGARVVIAGPEHHALMQALQSECPVLSHVVAPDDCRPAGDAASVAWPGVRADQLAYVIYTSGTTGVPKGVMVEHRAVLRLVRGADFLRLGPSDRVLMTGALSFDACTFEIWGPLLNGGAFCRPAGRTALDGAAIARLVREHRITTMWLTATLCNHYVDHEPTVFQGLRHLLTGGEKLSALHIARLRAAYPTLTVINGYGPTENTTFTCCFVIPPGTERDPAQDIPIGRPIANTTVWIVDADGLPVGPGVEGELWTGGDGVARGYLNDAALTAARFVSPAWLEGQRVYRTGDLARWREDGVVEYLGRADQQVKIRGFRIELSEIELALGSHPDVRACAVLALQAEGGTEKQLVAYVVPQRGDAAPGDWREFLAARLPDYMVPQACVGLAALPRTANGKLDRAALPSPVRHRPDLAVPYRAPVSDLERRLCDAMAQVLALAPVGADDNFFDLGGTSLALLRVLARLREQGLTLDATSFFRLPTAAALARVVEAPDASSATRLDPRRQATLRASPATPAPAGGAEAVAIVAMAGRFPGAADVEAYWANLVAGIESIRRFDAAELDPWVPAALREDPSYVRARGVLDGVADFDAAFFGMSPREAALTDPQQRVLLELCWECLERGGYVPDATPGPVGVFAGMNNATYFQRHLLPQPQVMAAWGEFQVMLANEKDYIATRVAHKLDLTGPAISVHTACSTSLVAVAQAVNALRARQCDMALAGGVSLTCPPNSGYLYQEGAMLSPDGHTRSFSDSAQGTVFSDGAGVLLLKRLADAQANGDPIVAVIRGVAVNNDGGAKASFTAPSVDGQAAVVAAALADAQVEPRSVSYIEAHGTATPLGDPVEIEGLVRAWRHDARRDGTGWCGIGSVKSNIGHAVYAAGAAGLIKTALSLQHEHLPATLHHDAANPKIDFASSPFQVVAEPRSWPRTAHPRRAGVSSFGVGGTNAHVIVEEAPATPERPASAGPHLLIWSARSAAARDTAATRLSAHLAGDRSIDLGDVAHTLRVGRKAFAWRACAAVDDVADAPAVLTDPSSAWLSRAPTPVGAAAPGLIWLFPGQGAQYAAMGSGLVAADPVFRAAYAEALACLRPHLNVDLESLLASGDHEALRPTSITQPATFALEYALGKAWWDRGLRPVALIGHSVGEFAAAVLANVMSLADAARLVARRGALMQAQIPGAMLSVRASAARIASRLPEGLGLAADNGPTACVVSGPEEAVVRFAAELEAEGLAVRRLQTSHAFHSSMMDAAVAPFEDECRSARLTPPQRPIYSTATGLRLTDGEAVDPAYWGRHLRETVQFSPALQRAIADHPGSLTLEIGPRASLSALVRQHGTPTQPAPAAIASLADAADLEARSLLLAAGRLWTLGVGIDLGAFQPGTDRHRVQLPTYPFERRRHWIDAPASALVERAGVDAGRAASPSLQNLTLPAPNMPTNAQPSAVDRKPRLQERLRAVFEDVSGLDLVGPEVPGDAAFVELGLDSLTLTQAALQVKKEFGVALSFRQLMESFRSFDALTAYLDSSLPPETAAAAAAPVEVPVATVASVAAAATPAPNGPPTSTVIAPSMMMTSPQAAPAGSLQGLIQQQMQLMSQQLALLAGQAVAVPAAQITPTPAVPAAPIVTAPPVAPATAPSPGAMSSATASAPSDAAEGASPVRYDVKKAFGAIARIHTQSGALSERQHARLAAFTRRYVERTQKSKAYTTEHRSQLADPRVVNGFRPITKEITYQVVIERSKGARLWDLDGNEYVDVLNGFGMNLFGWQADFIQEAVKRQLDAGYEIGPQHPLAGDVARLMCELTGFDRAALCNTGSEAVMAAVRIARTVTGRNTVVLFSGSYHGTFDEVLVRAGKQHKGLPAAPGIMPGVFGDARVLEYGTPESLAYIREHADDLAAVLVEPVQSRRPDFQPREFLRELREITSRSGACLIFDEVITGFRAHLGGVQAMFGIKADLASYGKVIGGGMPIGVIAGRREFMDALDGGHWQFGDDSIPTVGVTYFAGTFVRHPLALAAAKAALEHLKASGTELQTKLNLHTAAMADELTAHCREVGAPIEIRHFGSLWRVTWLEDHPLQDLLFAMMRSRGVHILDNFPCFLTTAHTSDDIARIKTAFKESLAELQEAEFLPRRAAAPTVDPSRPPVPNARLGRDKDGTPTWFVPDPRTPGKYVKVGA